MARKRLNAYDAVQAGKGASIAQHIPAIRTLEKSLRSTSEISPDLIDDWGPVDRLEEEGVSMETPNDHGYDGSFSQLKNSIQEHGQHVPVLVRPSKSKPQRYEVIYGRRRLRACRELGCKVIANIQDVDDDTALMAKGLENAGRRDLSFYEKALFAEEIAAQKQTAQEIGDVLGVHRTVVQNLKRVTKAIPRKVGVSIGAAPNSGRRKWFALAEVFETKKVDADLAMSLLDQMSDQPSDQRLDQLLKEVARHGAEPKKRHERSPIAGVTIKSGGQGVSITVKKGDFATWLDQNIDDVLHKALAEFEATKRKE